MVSLLFSVMRIVTFSYHCNELDVLLSRVKLRDPPAVATCVTLLVGYTSKLLGIGYCLAYSPAHCVCGGFVSLRSTRLLDRQPSSIPIFH
jgi:hypothetical protein